MFFNNSIFIYSKSDILTVFFIEQTHRNMFIY